MSKIQELKSILKQVKTSGKIDENLLYDLEKNERDLIYRLYKDRQIEEALILLENLDVNQEWDLLQEKLKSSNQSKLFYLKPFLKYAAVFVGVIGLGLYFSVQNEQPEKVIQVVDTETIRLNMGKNDIKVINQNENQQIISATGQVLGLQNGNKITYDSDVELGELVYNELEIPNGKVFDLELSDGTLVHLNSGTKMKYPVQFLKGQKREVFIYGEGYFKVAEDKNHPFIVHADDVAVEVLGTEFNISSYKEDSEIHTVLVEGSVSQTNAHISDNILLKPGFKAAWNKTSYETGVEKVDTSIYTGWIKGELIFRNVSFDNMARKLERKYNVTIQNNNVLLAQRVLNASFSKDVESIEDVLKSINQIQPFAYRITNNQIQID